MGKRLWLPLTLATIKGNFAGQADFPENEQYWASDSAIMLQFDGTKRIQIKKTTEGSNGSYVSAVGGGNYNLQSNCTGVANITYKQNGVVVGRGRMDFVVGGTTANPEILGTYLNKDDRTTGSVRLIKSNL